MHACLLVLLSHERNSRIVFFFLTSFTTSFLPLTSTGHHSLRKPKACAVPGQPLHVRGEKARVPLVLRASVYRGIVVQIPEPGPAGWHHVQLQKGIRVEDLREKTGKKVGDLEVETNATQYEHIFTHTRTHMVVFSISFPSLFSYIVLQ